MQHGRPAGDKSRPFGHRQAMENHEKAWTNYEKLRQIKTVSFRANYFSGWSFFNINHPEAVGDKSLAFWYQQFRLLEIPP
jgi:hypothetical protein